MVRLWLRCIGALSVVCLLPIMLIPALPRDNGGLSVFVTSAMDCPLPCFLGVRPGVTPAAEALDMLRQHEWISNARMNASGRGYGDIRWDWSGAQPGLIDTSRPMRMTFYWDEEDPYLTGPEDAVIETISFYTSIRIYNVQTWYGDPDASAATVSVGDLMNYMAAYYGRSSMMYLSTVMACPTSLLSYWEARAKFTMSVGYLGDKHVPFASLMDTC